MGPINTASTSRAEQQQSVFLVKYKGPKPTGGELTEPYSLVSAALTAEGASQVHYVLTGDAGSSSVSAAAPAAIPSGTSGSAALEAQVFNLVAVPR